MAFDKWDERPTEVLNPEFTAPLPDYKDGDAIVIYELLPGNTDLAVRATEPITVVVYKGLCGERIKNEADFARGPIKR